MNLKHSYSDEIIGKKIAILGHVPPPLGGVSVHIQRVVHKFAQQHNRVYLFNTLKRNWLVVYVCALVWFLIKRRPDLVYYHTVDLNSRLHEFRLLVFLKKILKFQLIVIEHNCRYLDSKPVEFKNKFSNLIRQLDQIVLIGQSSYSLYVRNAIRLPKKFFVQSAFLPPNLTQEQQISAQYPPKLDDFIRGCSQLLVISAFDLSLLNNKDLYGIDQTIEALNLLKIWGNDPRLVIGLASNTNLTYFDFLSQKIKQLNLDAYIYFLIGNVVLWPLIKRATVFVRPTLSDGQSVSIDEALYFNVPVVASNAVPRQKGVVLFESGNYVDLSEKIDLVLTKGAHEQTDKQRHFMHAQ